MNRREIETSLEAAGFTVLRDCTAAETAAPRAWFAAHARVRKIDRYIPSPTQTHQIGA